MPKPLARFAPVALALLAGGPAQGQEATDPDWLRMPNPYQMMAVFPQEALRRGVGGEAVIRCHVSRQGALYDCGILKERPEGMGFGAAAIALTPQFQMKPATVQGQAVVDTVNIPIRFFTPSPSAFSHISRGAPASMATVRFLASPVWAKAPTYDDVIAAYPSRARQEQIGGSATVGCAITSDLHLRHCNVIAEHPRGKGFGRAATALAEQFRLGSPADPAENLQGAETQFRVTFAPEMLGASQRLVGKPQWTSLPSGQIIEGAYPPAAREATFESARVQMRCTVGAEGGLEACAIAMEEPADLGFGAATLSLAPHFRLSVWSAEGLPTVGGNVLIPLRFEPTKTSAAPAP